jgi:predicted transposase YbfD/YdcC
MDEQVTTLVSMLAAVPDPRGVRGRRHPWSALLLLVVAGLASGANGQRALARWGRDAGLARRRRLGFTHRRSPSQATLHRVLRRVDVAALEARVGRWLQQVRAAWLASAVRWLDGIAVDGKTLRGARRLGAEDAYLLSAYGQRDSLVLGEVAVPDATNELGVVGALLDGLPLAGETVTFDALFTQWAVAERVVTAGGAYLMVVKGNQPTLLTECAATTADRPRRPRHVLGRARSVEAAHGRLEERTLLVVDARELPWPSARQVLRLRRRRVDKRTGAVLTDETVYAVTSLTPEQASPAALLRLWRRHWLIENRLHWVRDVVFAEDAATTHSAHAPQALAVFRNLALSLLHRWRGHDITAARQYYACHPAALVRRLGLSSRRKPRQSLGALPHFW